MPARSGPFLLSQPGTASAPPTSVPDIPCVRTDRTKVRRCFSENSMHRSETALEAIRPAVRCHAFSAPRQATCAVQAFLPSFKTLTASRIVFSYACIPYRSTSARFRSPCVRQPAPPMHPPVHAIPSMKLKSAFPCEAFKRATRHASIPSQVTGSSLKSLPLSFSASETASVSPPLRAKIRP